MGGSRDIKCIEDKTLNKLILSFSEDDYVLLERYFLQMKSEVSCPLLFNFIRPCAFAHLSLKNKDKWRTWGVGLFNSITTIMLRLALGGVFFFLQIWHFTLLIHKSLSINKNQRKIKIKNVFICEHCLSLFGII